MNRVFLTGANGFIGGELINSLKDSYKVIPTSRSQQRSDVISSDFVQLDLLNRGELINQFPQNIDMIIHCAGQTGLSANENIFKLNNEEATKNLIDVAIQKGVKNFFFFSSPSIYLSKNSATHIKEAEVPHRLMTAYAQSKLSSEQYLEKVKDHFSSITIIRPGTVYGEGAYSFAAIVNEARSKNKIISFSKETTSLSMTYIKNLVHAVKIVIESPIQGINIYNIADEEPISLNTDLLEAYYKSEGVIHKSTTLPFTPFYYLAMGFQSLYKFLGITSPPLLSPYIVCNLGKNRTMSIDHFVKDYNYVQPYNKTESLNLFSNWMKDIDVE
jgi:nucleoside-diphosphate-sugar epimerase